MMRRLTRAVLLILIICCARQAQAACTLTDGAGLAFGSYTGGGVAQDATNTWKVTTCTGGWSIPLNAGTGAGASETVRFMTGPGNAKISYAVYQSPGYTVNWGNTTGTEVTGTGNANGTYDGQITAGQYPTPGTYTDTLTTASTHFPVSVTVVSACTISATNLAFGTYTKALINSTSTISVTCTNTTTYNVGLSAGAGGSVTTRKMPGPGGYSLGYKLCSDGTSCSTNWGNTVGTDTKAGTGTGALQSLTVYGQLPAGQNVEAGNYTDTITATVTY
jgi:spore coat protein U-like protein